VVRSTLCPLHDGGAISSDAIRTGSINVPRCRPTRALKPTPTHITAIRAVPAAGIPPSTIDSGVNTISNTVPSRPTRSPPRSKPISPVIAPIVVQDAVAHWPLSMANSAYGTEQISTTARLITVRRAST